MDTSVSLAVILIMIPVFIAVLLLGLLISAFFLRICVRILEKFDMPWGDAILTAFLAWLAGVVVSLPYSFAMEKLGMNDIFAVISVFVIGIVVRGWVFGVRIAPPGDLPIGIGRGIRVALLLFAFIFGFTMMIVIGGVMVLFAIGSADVLSSLQ
jgi:hypothetical protein